MRDITRLLHNARHGDPVAEERLMESIYSELHRLASRFLSAERPDHTLQATALVNEAYLKLFGKKVTPRENRAHFYVSAARTMRRILLDYARAGAAVKRPSRQNRVEKSNVLALVRERSAEFIALDQALERLASWDERQAKIVELRFYCGTHRGGNRGRFRHLGKDRQARLEFGARLACQGKVESSAFEQSRKFRF